MFRHDDDTNDDADPNTKDGSNDSDPKAKNGEPFANYDVEMSINFYLV